MLNSAATRVLALLHMHYSQYISGNLEPDSVELGLLFQVAGSKVEKLGGRLVNSSSYSSAHSRARIYFMLQSLSTS